MSGGKGNSHTESTVRYPPYLEAAHQEFLNHVKTHVDTALELSPYEGYTDLEIETAFFGSGYYLSSFPSLYDMFGKFMAGLDIEVLFDEVFEDTVNGPVVNNLISAEADILSDDIEQEATPRFEAGMRDINSVMSSTFIIGKAMMEATRTKAISRFSAETRAKLLPLVVERWTRHLAWNQTVIEQYAQILKFYIIAKMDVTNHNFETHAKDVLWPFTVLEYNRVAIGALNGANTTTTDVAGASRAAKAIGGALGGAAAGAWTGAQIAAAGGPIGAIGGAIIGGVLGLAAGLL